MLPANMLGTVTSSCVACLMRSPLQPQQRQRRAAMRWRPTLRYDTSTDADAVVVAVDEPLEAEVDERRRFDEELAGGDRIGARCLRARAGAGSEARGEKDGGERKQARHAPHPSR